MSKASDAARAFPVTPGGRDGMSLRDYFAGRVIAELVHHMVDDSLGKMPAGAVIEAAAGIAYDFADAMIKSRALDKDKGDA